MYWNIASKDQERRFFVFQRPVPKSREKSCALVGTAVGQHSCLPGGQSPEQTVGQEDLTYIWLV